MEALDIYNYMPNYTYEDYKEWEGKWELISGVPFSMAPAPTKRHQMIIGYIFSELAPQIDKCPNCELLIDSDWKLNSQSILKPDVSIVCDDANRKYISKTPEVVFEVVSPSTAKRDENLKYIIYQGEGVKYYILVYPNDLIAKVYKNHNFKFRKVGEFDREIVDFIDIKCEFNLNFEAIFKRFRED